MKVQDYHGKSVIDSREVAEMVEKQHKNLLRDISGYIKIMKESAELKIEPSDFFIESSYPDGNNQLRPCYLVTRKGCDMIANKTTGKKGVLFTAAYVDAFEKMKKVLNAPHPTLPEGVTFSSAVGFMRLTRRAMLDMGASPFDVGMMIKQTCEAISFPVPSALTKQFPGQTSLFEHQALEG